MKKKILYVHGYHGSPTGKSFNTLKNVLPTNYSIESIDYDETNISESIDKINKYVIDNNIDLVIGSSFGGFLVMMLDGCKRMVINPCYLPSVEIPIIDSSVSSEFINSCKYFETNVLSNSNDFESRMSLIGFFGNNDKLLGNKYHDVFKTNWLTDNNFVIINSGHHISSDGAKTIMSYLPIIDKRVNLLNHNMNIL